MPPLFLMPFLFQPMVSFGFSKVAINASKYPPYVLILRLMLQRYDMLHNYTTNSLHYYTLQLFPLLSDPNRTANNQCTSQRLPKYKKNIPINTKMRSTALLFKFFSRKKSAPKRKETTTLPRRTIETMEIMESS